MSQVVLLLTGLTDSPLRDLGGMTPLQKAHTPHLDSLAAAGKCIRATPPPTGGIETSLLALLGIEEPTSAAPLEAAAIGLALVEGETAYCARLVSAGGGTIVEVGDELIGDKEGALLCEALAGEGFRFVHVQGPRCLLITKHSYGSIPGPGPSPFEVVGKSWKGLLPKKVRAKLAPVLEWANQRLAEHEVNQLRADLEEVPVNALWVSEGGQKPSWMASPPQIEDLEIWCSTSVIRGVAKALKIPCKTLERSPRMDREIERLLKLLAKELPETLIIELPHLWESTYKGDLLEKIKRIEYLDRHLIGPLRERAITLLPLRHTDIRTGGIVAGSVPVLGVEGSQLTSYDEVSFAKAPMKPLDRVLKLPTPV